MKIINSKNPLVEKYGGFTLVTELLLVLVILAVLAAIVLPSMAHRGEDARVTAAKVDVANLATALNVFEVDNGYYPKGAGALQALLVKPREATNWKGPYLQKNKVPLDPWGNPYVYELLQESTNPRALIFIRLGKMEKAISAIGRIDKRSIGRDFNPSCPSGDLGYLYNVKTLTIGEAKGQLAELIAEAHQGAIIVLTDGEKQVWLDAHKPLDLETDNPELEAELLKSIDRPFTPYSSEEMVSIGQRVIKKNRDK